MTPTAEQALNAQIRELEAERDFFKGRCLALSIAVQGLSDELAPFKAAIKNGGSPDEKIINRLSVGAVTADRLAAGTVTTAKSLNFDAPLSEHKEN